MTIKTPVRYDGTNSDSMIFDATGRHILDIRGWGHLTGFLGLQPWQATKIQDELGEHIALCINEHERLTALVERYRAALEQIIDETPEPDTPNECLGCTDNADIARTALKDEK